MLLIKTSETTFLQTRPYVLLDVKKKLADFTPFLYETPTANSPLPKGYVLNGVLNVNFNLNKY